MQSTLVERLYQALLEGDRNTSRAIVEEARGKAPSPEDVVLHLFWPTYQRLETMYRSDEIGALPHHCATRLLRVLVDQHAASLPRAAPVGKSVIAFCGPRDADDLGAQMAVDLIEAAGFAATFAGGGIANDEILPRVNRDQPDYLLLFCSTPSDLPEIRRLIDTIRDLNACPHMRIIAGGGVFNRAEGLADELGADAWAIDPLEVVELVSSDWSGIELARSSRQRKRRRNAA